MAKESVLQIRIDQELKEKLRVLADLDGRTMSGYIEMLIKRALKNEGA